MNMSPIVIGTVMALMSLTMLYSSKRQVGMTYHTVSIGECNGGRLPYMDDLKISVKGNFEVGTDVTFTTTGDVKKPFTVASSYNEMFYSFFKVYSGETPISPPESYEVGTQTITTTQKITQQPKSGKYTLKTTTKDPNGNTLQCIKLVFKLS